MILTLSTFRRRVVRPTLTYLLECNPAFEDLLVGTALLETGADTPYARDAAGRVEPCAASLPLWNTKAHGPYAMYPGRVDALWRDVLTADREGLSTRVRLLASGMLADDPYGELDRNWSYATALAYATYVAPPTRLLPEPTALDLAAYYERHYQSAPCNIAADAFEQVVADGRRNRKELL